MCIVQYSSLGENLPKCNQKGVKCFASSFLREYEFLGEIGGGGNQVAEKQWIVSGYWIVPIPSTLFTGISDIFIFSYNIEHSHGHPCHIVTLVMKAHNLDLQGVVDRIADMCRESKESFHAAKALLPLWGTEIDNDVTMYIKCLKTGCLAVSNESLLRTLLSKSYLSGHSMKSQLFRVLCLEVQCRQEGD
ncbi:hypothetical protein BU17DRAFT_71974 [Hysterangium stoloniferum]|nr:hypothetical protein BU17DRAFT_71974 [Hysterangium stoloniferum]